jgi:hypothetical protein
LHASTLTAASLGNAGPAPHRDALETDGFGEA